jgi:hypothetical protein
MIRCRLAKKGAPWRKAGVRTVSTHEKQKPDAKEESGAGRGHGSDSSSRTGDNRGGRSNAWAILRLACHEKAAGLQARTMLRGGRVEGVTLAFHGGRVR